MADKIGNHAVARAREKAINAYCEGRTEEYRKETVQDLYEVLCKIQPYAKHIRAEDMTMQEMYSMVERMSKFGWAQAIYMPIASFTSEKPLRFLLAHKQELLGNKGHEAFADSYYRLRRHFVGLFG